MAGENYKVEASLRLRAEAGIRSVQAFSSRLGDLATRIGGAQSMAGGLVRNIVGLGAGYVGINALASGFSALTRGAVAYQTSLESTRIGLASVMSAVEGMSFDRAQGEAEELFGQIREDAITSVATSQQLFGIFQGIYGPLRNAGLELQDIRSTTLDVVSASSALGIDFEQANRDVQAMARGAAGVDVRLFSMLRSTGAIAEDAEAFNALSAPERISRMRTALQQFSGAASAYGRSFAGVTSTFQDIVETLTGAFFGGSFNAVRDFLSDMNERLLANREALTAGITAAGDRLAAGIETAFDRILVGYDWVAENWDRIVQRGEDFVGQVRAMIPQLVAAAKVWGAITLAREGLAMGLGAASMATGAASIAGELGIGLGAAGAGTAAVGATGAAVAGEGAAAAGAGTLGSALSALAPVFAVVAAVVAAVASAVMVANEYWSEIVDVFDTLSPLTSQLWEDFYAIGESLWEILRPLMRLVGGAVLFVLGGLFILLLGVLRVLLGVVRAVIGALASLANVFEEYVVTPLLDGLMAIAQALAEFTTFVTMDQVGALRRRLHDRDVIGDPLGELEAEVGAREGARPFTWSDVPADRRPVQHNDFRGSRITVNQEFRQADPDRIMLSIVEDLNRQAEQRITSGFAPALARTS